MARRPRAPAHAQRAASSLIPATMPLAEGLALLKTQSLQCFQIIQGMTNVADARPLRIGFGVLCLAVRHQSTKLASVLGTWQVSRSQHRMSCHTCRERGQPRNRCRIVSGSWSHSGQRGGCGRPRRARHSAVQHLSRLASQ